MTHPDKCREWPENICADRHEITGKWVLHYLTDEQAKICNDALLSRPQSAQQEVDEDMLADIMARAFAPDLWAHDNANADFYVRANAMTVEAAKMRAATIRRMKAALETIKPHLSQPVSLEKCVKAVSEFCENNMFDSEIVTKICLDAAGVPYKTEGEV